MFPSVLVIEDETGLASAIESFLRRRGASVWTFPSAEAALPALGELSPDVAVVDFQLPGMDGLAALAAIRQERPETLVILMTAHGSVATAVAAIKGGAVDYLTKPVDLEELSVVIERAWAAARVRSEVLYLRRQAGHGASVESLRGDSPSIGAVRDRLGQIARADRLGDAGPTVLITGETGTGKQLAARALHAAGPRAGGPFVELNCAAIPATLIEAELFGFEKGAYTDARAGKPGLFEAADGGTLFLDEIGLLDLGLQAKLLKVLEDRAVRRLGAITPRRVDVRILAATNRDIAAAAREGGFRQDLLYRLSVLTVELPPLRSRGADVALLAQHFLATLRARYRIGPLRFSDPALRALGAYRWPGNVRELSNVIERAGLLAPGPVLEPSHLGLDDGTPAAGSLGVTPGADGVISIDLARGPISLEALEQQLIRAALQRAGWNRGRAAELLGLTKETLRYRIEKYGISAP